MANLDFNLLNGPQKKALRGALVAAFRRAEFDGLLQDVGFAPLENYARDLEFPLQVQDLLGKFSRRGELNELMAKVLEERGGNPALRDLGMRLSLLEDPRAGAIDYETAVQDAIARGAPDRVRTQQLELQKLVRDGGFFDTYLWIALLEDAVARVCRISYPVDGEMGHGSGFLVGPDLVLTNYHVIEPLLRGRSNADTVRCVFGFAEMEAGPSAGTAYRLAAEWELLSSKYSDTDIGKRDGAPAEDELDFALVRLDVAAGGKDGRGWVKLPRSASPDWRAKEFCFILQHPRGRPLKHTMGLTLESPTALRVRYDADSAKGSSGGLVLDAKMQPAALHHAGDPREGVKAEYNQGIPLYLVRQYIEARRPGVLG